MRANKPGRRSRFVVLIGCGSLGASTASRLSARGDSVVVVDRDPSAFVRLSSDYSGFTVEGDAAQLEVLEQAKTRQADLFIGATGCDSLNIFASQIAKHRFGVKEVVVRLSDPELGDLCRRLGIPFVCPVSLGVDGLL